MTADVSRQTYPFKLPDLPYAYDALEPYMDAKTVEIHHSKHHATYVNKLNEALEKEKDLQRLTLGQLLFDLAKLPENVRGAVRNNGGGHLNHDFFWRSLTPPDKGVEGPSGALSDAIGRQFGSTDEFRKRFADAAAKHFASGWVALALEHSSGKLVVMNLKDHDVLRADAYTGLMIIDVWEHAYYLKYQNRRPEFIDAFWKVLNWQQAAEWFVHAAARRAA